MAHRDRRLHQIRLALRGKRLSWFSTRGLDLAPLARTGLLCTVSSLAVPLLEEAAAGGVKEDCLELRLRRREDLNRYDIDQDSRLEACSFREDLLARPRAPEDPSGWLLGAYRPARFQTAIDFTRSDVSAGHLFADSQRVFEHKPWVERELGRIGVKTLDWSYFRDAEASRMHQTIEEFGRIVVRSTFSAGGAGLRLVESTAKLQEAIPAHDDGFVAYSPYLQDALPLNLNACVYANGQVRGFHLSVQLIGIEACTDLPFGFCGNDFASAALLDSRLLLEAELITNRVGQWAFGHGYRGQFGLDFLLHDGELLVAEINPRFQASSYLSEGLAEAQDLSGPYLEHLASFLELPPPSMTELPDISWQTESCGSLGDDCELCQIICYNDRGADLKVVKIDRDHLVKNAQVLGVPGPEVVVAPGAMLGKLKLRDRVTDTGLTLLEPYSRIRAAFHTSQVF